MIVLVGSHPMYLSHAVDVLVEPLAESEAVMPVGEGSDIVDRPFTLLLEVSYMENIGFCV